MTKHYSRFHPKTTMNDRQLKSFDIMFEDGTYSYKSITERFGMSQSSILDLAKERNLNFPHRKAGRGFKE